MIKGNFNYRSITKNFDVLKLIWITMIKFLEEKRNYFLNKMKITFS